MWSLAMAALTRGEWEPARAFGERLRARAERDDDQVLWVESDYLQGIAAYWPGRLTAARGHFEAAMVRFRPERRRAHVLRYGQDPELLVRLRLAHTLWLLGHPGQADRQRDLALQAASQSSHAYSRAVTWVWSAILALDRGEAEKFRSHALAVSWSPRRRRSSSRRSCAAGRCSAYPCSTSAIRRPEPPRCSRSGTSVPPWTTSARCPIPPSRRPSTRSRRGTSAAFTPAGSTCPGSATPRSRCSSPTPPTWSRSARRSAMIIFRIGQGVAAVPGEATAFSHRDARYLFHPITAWLDPADGEKMIAVTRAFAAAMRPFSAGASYLNFTPRGRPGPRRLRRCYVRPPGGPQGHLRPGQPVPAQPEHPAQPARRGARARVSSRAYCGSRTFCHTGKIAEG